MRGHGQRCPQCQGRAGRSPSSPPREGGTSACPQVTARQPRGQLPTQSSHGRKWICSVRPECTTRPLAAGCTLEVSFPKATQARCPFLLSASRQPPWGRRSPDAKLTTGFSAKSVSPQTTSPTVPKSQANLRPHGTNQSPLLGHDACCILLMDCTCVCLFCCLPALRGPSLSGGGVPPPPCWSGPPWLRGLSLRRGSWGSRGSHPETAASINL